jgi:hypothetical protein
MSRQQGKRFGIENAAADFAQKSQGGFVQPLQICLVDHVRTLLSLSPTTRVEHAEAA